MKHARLMKIDTVVDLSVGFLNYSGMLTHLSIRNRDGSGGIVLYDSKTAEHGDTI